MILLYKSSTKNIFIQVVVHMVPFLVIFSLLCKTGLIPVKACCFLPFIIWKKKKKYIDTVFQL